MNKINMSEVRWDSPLPIQIFHHVTLMMVVRWDSGNPNCTDSPHHRCSAQNFYRLLFSLPDFGGFVWFRFVRTTRKRVCSQQLCLLLRRWLLRVHYWLSAYFQKGALLLISHSRWFDLKGGGSKKDSVAAFRGHTMPLLNHKTRYVAVLIRHDMVQMSLHCSQSLLCSKGLWCLLCFVVAGAVGPW